MVSPIPPLVWDIIFEFADVDTHYSLLQTCKRANKVGSLMKHDMTRLRWLHTKHKRRKKETYYDFGPQMNQLLHATHQSFEMCVEAFKENSLAIGFVKPELLTSELYFAYIKIHPPRFDIVPVKFLTVEMFEYLLGCPGIDISHVFRHFPQEMQSHELCTLALQGNAEAFIYMRDDLKTMELCAQAVRQWSGAMLYVPEHMRTYELYLGYVLHNPTDIQYVPEQYQTEELCETAIRQNSSAIRYIADSAMTESLCLKAIEYHGYSGVLCNIKSQYQTPVVCLAAVMEDPHSIRFVDFKLRTDELIKLAIQKDPYVISCFTKIRPEFFLMAVKKNPTLTTHVGRVDWPN